METDKLTILLNAYTNCCEWERHNENQRAQLVNIVLIISAALIAFHSSGQRQTDWLIPIALIILGIFGFLAIIKYWERFMYHSTIDEEYLKALDSYFAPKNDQSKEIKTTPTENNLLLEIREKAIREHESKPFPLLKDRYIKQHWLWEGIFVIITLLGVGLFIEALLN